MLEVAGNLETHAHGWDRDVADLLREGARAVGELRDVLEKVQVTYATMGRKSGGFGELLPSIHAALAHLELPRPEGIVR